VNLPQNYLEHYLAPINSRLERDAVTDIYINRPGELWIETLGGKIEREEEPSLTEAYLWRLAQQIAAQSFQGVSRSRPLLTAMISDHVRVQFVAPPATRNSVAIAFRRHMARSPTLLEYDFSIEKPQGEKQESRTAEPAPPLTQPREFLDWAVRHRKNIVISGGTSTGKTTLLNSLIQIIPQQERLIAIEDTPELKLAHPNSIGLIAVRGLSGESNVTTLDLLESSLRMRPDRIILGELLGPEAFTFLRAINTGHPGSITTVHADSPEGAIRQLVMMTLQADIGIQYRDVVRMVVSMIDVIVQMHRIDDRRTITDIVVPQSHTFNDSINSEGF
jgi:type IV secretion system protein VirB11